MREEKRAKPKGRCECCGRRYTLYSALLGKHEGYCSRLCSLGKGLEITLRKREQTFSLEEKRKARQIRRQEKLALKKNPKIKKDFYSSQEWRELRFKVLRTYGSFCMLCFRKARPGFPMHVDHIKPRCYYPELEMDFSNLQVLCEDCNKGKLHHTEDDFRPKT